LAADRGSVSTTRVDMLSPAVQCRGWLVTGFDLVFILNRGLFVCWTALRSAYKSYLVVFAQCWVGAE